MENKEPKDNWILESIELKFQNWGENAGKYEGKIMFRNGEWESFSFKIRPDMAEKYIQLLSGDIVRSAESLGERLIESLNLKNSKIDGK